MKIIKGYRSIEQPMPSPVLTLGNFDGVHLGHQKILSQVKDRARAIGGTSVVYTFHPHPLSVLRNQNHILTITTIDEKIRLIEKCGIDAVICEPFSREFARIQAEAFVKNILVGSLGVTEIYVGHDYAFGSNRHGNAEYLQRMGEELGFRVKIIDSIIIDTVPVRSTKIRQLIQQGDIKMTNRLLGRNYALSGHVVEGKKRGNRLGFPTANIEPDKVLYPAVGVYAVWVYLGNERFEGAMNIGFNPTFGGQKISLEVHILDFDRDIYGQELEVRFVERIRGEQPFSSPQELVAQLQKDVVQVRTILSESPEVDHPLPIL